MESALDRWLPVIIFEFTETKPDTVRVDLARTDSVRTVALEIDALDPPIRASNTLRSPPVVNECTTDNCAPKIARDSTENDAIVTSFDI